MASQVNSVRVAWLQLHDSDARPRSETHIAQLRGFHSLCGSDRGALVHNTITILTRMPEQKAEWWEALD